MCKNKRRRGSAVVEFALTGIPLICLTISTVQMGISMWHYHTIQYAVKNATAYLTHRGQLYLDAGNSAIKIKDVASVLSTSAVGMPSTTLNVTFKAYKSETDIQTVTCRLDSCLTNTTNWPPSGYNVPNTCSVSIKADYSLSTAFVMFAPGTKGGGVKFANRYTLPGYARQIIMF